MKCKHCNEEMGVVAKYRIDGNDPRMVGDYCQRKCMDERRTSLPPFKDPRWDKKKVVEVDTTPTVTSTPVTPVVNQDAVAQGFEGFFNPETIPDDDEENPLSKLFG